MKGEYGMSPNLRALAHLVLSLALLVGAIAGRVAGHPSISVVLLLILTGQAVYLWRRSRPARRR